MVATEACSRATCDSSAIVTLSRKRRWTRVLTVRRNHVAVADTASPNAAAYTRRGRCWMTPLPSSSSHSASSASGSADNCDNRNAMTISRGSCWYPSLHKRHIDESAGGSGPMSAVVTTASGLGEDVIRCPLLFAGRREALGLQIEHRPVASAERDQLVVRAQLDG